MRHTLELVAFFLDRVELLTWDKNHLYFLVT